MNECFENDFSSSPCSFGPQFTRALGPRPIALPVRPRTGFPLCVGMFNSMSLISNTNLDPLHHKYVCRLSSNLIG